MKPGNLVKPNKFGLKGKTPGVRDLIVGAVGLVMEEYPLAYKVVDGEREYGHLVRFEELANDPILSGHNLFFNDEVEVLS